MTTTIDNIDHLQEVIAEYVQLGFNGVFIRPLNPYGLAAMNAQQLGYSVEHFVEKFENALNFIIDLNINGTRFVEFFTSILLTRILTPFSTDFVDLQSPSGAGYFEARFMTTMEMFFLRMKRECSPEWVTAASSLEMFSKIPMKVFLVVVCFERLSANHVSRSCLIELLCLPCLLRF